MKLLLALAIGCLPGAAAATAQEKTANDLLQESLKQAKEGKKRVLLTFGAPG